MFRPVNPDSRFPAVLQSHTKANIVAQLAATVVFLGFMWAKDAYEERKLNKEIELEKSNPTTE